MIFDLCDVSNRMILCQYRGGNGENSRKSNRYADGLFFSPVCATCVAKISRKQIEIDSKHQGKRKRVKRKE